MARHLERIAMMLAERADENRANQLRVFVEVPVAEPVYKAGSQIGGQIAAEQAEGEPREIGWRDGEASDDRSREHSTGGDARAFE